MSQLALFAESTSAMDLTAYDRIVINTSAGKDSQAMMDYVVALARQAGVIDRVSALHCDLGRVEWDGTVDLAVEQCEAYGIPLAIVAKIDTEAAPADLLDRIEQRGMWPSSAARFCTSDYKRGPARKHYTALAAQWREATGEARPCRILHVMGLRAEESAARAKRPGFTEAGARHDLPRNGRQHVDEWLPILGWTEGDVWDRIRRSGVRHHWAYDAGMPRLSCSFCVLASRSALVRAAQLRPELAAEYARVEAEIGHTFQSRTSMADIIAEAELAGDVEVEGWAA